MTELLRTLTFNEDGTLNPEDLEGYSPEAIAEMTSPEFVERARQMIAEAKLRDQRLAQLRRDIEATREKAILEREARRPSGISGRQRKRLRRTVRKVYAANLSQIAH